VRGEKLYELARRGEEIERKPIRVTISKFESMSHDDGLLQKNDDGTCDLKVRVICSAGTYVRVLAEYFGKLLGIGAHLAELRRTSAGQFRIDDAISLEQLNELAQSNSSEQILISPHAALAHLPAVQLNADDESQTLHGIDMQMENSEWPEGQSVRMRFGSELVAVGTYDTNRNIVHPR